MAWELDQQEIDSTREFWLVMATLNLCRLV